jgi:hypothetical protein
LPNPSRWLVLALTAVLSAIPTVEIAAPEGPAHLPVPVNLSKGDLPRPKIPALRNERERAAWELVSRYCGVYGIEEKAPLLFGVIRTESACLPEVVSPCGRYHGLCQFTRGTFDASVRRMKRLGLLNEEVSFSPMDPEHAVHVMAWMWSQGGHGHWGPARKFFRQLARTPKTSPRPSATLAAKAG